MDASKLRQIFDSLDQALRADPVVQDNLRLLVEDLL
jgi:hypothetical protein